MPPTSKKVKSEKSQDIYSKRYSLRSRDVHVIENKYSALWTKRSKVSKAKKEAEQRGISIFMRRNLRRNNKLKNLTVRHLLLSPESDSFGENLQNLQEEFMNLSVQNVDVDDLRMLAAVAAGLVNQQTELLADVVAAKEDVHMQSVEKLDEAAVKQDLDSSKTHNSTPVEVPVMEMPELKQETVEVIGPETSTSEVKKVTSPAKKKRGSLKRKYPKKTQIAEEKQSNIVPEKPQMVDKSAQYSDVEEDDVEEVHSQYSANKEDLMEQTTAMLETLSMVEDYLIQAQQTAAQQFSPKAQAAFRSLDELLENHLELARQFFMNNISDNNLRFELIYLSYLQHNNEVLERMVKNHENVRDTLLNFNANFKDGPLVHKG